MTAGREGEILVNYSVLQMPITYGFRKEFTTKVRMPQTGIDMQAVSSSVVQALTNQTWTYVIPDAASLTIPGYRLQMQ